jgi:hypothetical protein
MDHDLNLYNVDTLQELYAVSFWKAYKVWPRANGAIKASKPELVQAIKELSDKLQENYYANGN